MELKREDLKIIVLFDNSGPWGVVIKHIPSGIVVESVAFRSFDVNEAKALKMLEAKIAKYNPPAPIFEVEKEFAVSWIRDNPHLFEMHFNKFFDDYAKDCVIRSEVRKGFILLHAKLR